MHGVGYSLFLAEHYISLQATVTAVQYCSSLHSGILKYGRLRDGGQTYSNVEPINHQHHDNEAEESNNGHSLTDTSRVIRSKRMGRADHVACIGEIIFVNRGN